MKIFQFWSSKPDSSYQSESEYLIIYYQVFFQFCGSRMIIPDPNFFRRGSRIRIKEFKYFNPQKIVSKPSNIWSGIRILIFYPSRIPDSGVKKTLDPRYGSATLIFCRQWQVSNFGRQKPVSSDQSVCNAFKTYEIQCGSLTLSIYVGDLFDPYRC